MHGKHCIFILLLSVGVSHQLIQTDTAEVDNDTDTTTRLEETTTAVPRVTEPPKKCTTAKNLDGSCVARQFCDFSTNAIDFTLYATRNYVRFCQLGQVCCPHKYTVTVEQPSYQVDNNFEFDEDD